MFKEPNPEHFGYPKLKINRYGTKRWHLNDKLHRTDGPAIETTNGTKVWYLNDQLHREDGPAVEWEDGTKQWYLNGKEYLEEDFAQKVKKYV